MHRFVFCPNSFISALVYICCCVLQVCFLKFGKGLKGKNSDLHGRTGLQKVAG